ncbi:MAG: DUF169 domain-containing protein [Thermodesulfobacteriota bacterium]
MDIDKKPELSGFLETLGLNEEPVGICFTDKKPENGLSPDYLDTFSREEDMNNEVNWNEVFSNFSCSLGHIKRARKQKKCAWFSKNHYGCPGAAFWMGFVKPQAETIINYVSTGIPGVMEGEFYCSSPHELEKIFAYIDPEPAMDNYLVFKPLSLFKENETPLLITFFSRPESLAGLHQLATFVSNDPEVVASPWSAACGSLVAWPLRYLSQGKKRAVIGGWDPSARQFFKNDELSFTIPYVFFNEMVASYKDSFLKTGTWAKVQKKIKLSKKVWKEI